ncbi:transcription activator effector-binding protein [Clostridium cellulovorans]|uniref:Transcription activator effector binding n=1 Tax=Clostridium cellulovorans (strain ATCC 35296 / DSM 3052 / OCM 3 / 743B) TaxID=573061 RepID=D9SSI3_CLOC7|nr:transcription activator effector-binding protein [Clostridium cellulovorans]ADL50580.1 transcription activator effector binding [Clostridium cellulovorans 743B]
MITLDNEISFKNLLSFRKTLTQAELQEEMKKIEEFLNKNNLKKNGPTITTTYSVNQAMIPTMDFEVLIPLEGNMPFSDTYKVKKEFKLVNALKVSHIGNPAGIQQTVMGVQKYIKENNLQPITSLYNVTINEVKSVEEMDKLHVDMYIGLNPNIV